MARKGSTLLDTGDPFPTLELRPVNGPAVALPESGGPGYAVLLIYRGYW
jgi:hypothetical protein